MTARNVVARIVKLEAGQRRQDGLLLVWRKPGADVREALNGADYSPGDRVVCVEWFSGEPVPAPAAGSLQGPRDPAFIDYPRVPEHKLVDMTDLDLWPAMFGVAV